MRELFLLGRRRAAHEAATRLGYAPVVFDRPPRVEQAHRAYGGTSEEALVFSGDRFPGVRPAAVVGVAEGTVLAAARVREALGVDRGLSAAVAARGHDKALMKRAMVAAGVPCARAVVIDFSTTAESLIDELGLPLVLKVPISSGGRGVRIVETREQVEASLLVGLLAEELIDGIEMSVETFMTGGTIVFRSFTRYVVPRWANVVPADLPPDVADAVHALADRALAALGVDHGITHMEAFLTKDGPLFSEVAARPPGGRIMDLIALAYDFDPWEAALKLDLGLVVEPPSRPFRYSGVYMLHPGAGRVESVTGVKEAREADGVVHVRCSVSAGDEVPARLGTGETVGEVRVVDSTGEGCVTKLRDAERMIRIALASSG
jgi:biotin carboxylase